MILTTDCSVTGNGFHIISVRIQVQLSFLLELIQSLISYAAVCIAKIFSCDGTSVNFSKYNTKLLTTAGIFMPASFFL